MKDLILVHVGAESTAVRGSEYSMVRRRIEGKIIEHHKNCFVANKSADTEEAFRNCVNRQSSCGTPGTQVHVAALSIYLPATRRMPMTRLIAKLKQKGIPVILLFRQSDRENLKKRQPMLETLLDRKDIPSMRIKEIDKNFGDALKTLGF